MELERKNKSGYGNTYSRWVKESFELLERKITNARIRKDGYFYKNDSERIVQFIDYAFHSLDSYFVITAEIADERETFSRMLETLPAEQFKQFALVIIEPYKTIIPIENE